MNKKMLFIFNPHSGKAQMGNYLFDVVDIFVKGGYLVTVHPTQGKDDAYNMIKTYAAKYDIVVISGGDGTLNESVRGMMEYPIEQRKPMGYIPTGTTNDFALSRGISRDIIDAAETIIKNNVVYEDIGLLNGRVFNYVAAFGAFTDVSYDTPQAIKNIFGQAAYVMEGIKRLPTLESFYVKLKSKETEINDYFCVGCVLNSTSMAGISFDGIYDVNLDDGLFEMVLIKMPVTLIQAQQIISAVMRGEEETDKFRLIRSSEFEIEFEDAVKWTLDGEYGGAHKKVKIEVKNKAMSFIV